MRKFAMTAAFLLIASPAFAQHRGQTPRSPHQTTTRFQDNLGHPKGYVQRQGNVSRFYTNQGYPQGRSKTQGSTTKFYSNQGYPQGRSTTKR